MKSDDNWAMRAYNKNLHWSLAAVVLLIPVWWVAYQSTHFIANPLVVAQALPQFLSDAETWSNIGITLWRVVLGLGSGVLAGTLAALAMNQNKLLEQVLRVYVIAALRTPSAISAIMALAIFKGDEIGYIFVVAIVTFPFMAVGLIDGLKSADRELDNMARIYHFGLLRHVRHVLLPYIAPYIFSSLRNAHALAWKVIVVAEIFGAARSGFGAKFDHAWEYMLMVEVHLWLLVFMALVLFVEYGVLRIAERYVFRWRD